MVVGFWAGFVPCRETFGMALSLATGGLIRGISNHWRFLFKLWSASLALSVATVRRCFLKGKTDAFIAIVRAIIPMSDWTLEPHVALVFGAQRSGKTSFCFSYLLNVGEITPTACVFIYDDRGQAQRRLKLKPCGTARECEAALGTGWVCFDPNVMFRPNEKLGISATDALRNGFAWFCKWVLAASRRGPGRKVFFADEVWQFMDARSVPFELEDLVRTGRAENLSVILATHRPSEYHRNVRALVTEWVCFNTIDENDLAAVRPYFKDVDRAATLPKGQFLSYNREDGELRAGRLW